MLSILHVIIFKDPYESVLVSRFVDEKMVLERWLKVQSIGTESTAHGANHLSVQTSPAEHIFFLINSSNSKQEKAKEVQGTEGGCLLKVKTVQDTEGMS